MVYQYWCLLLSRFIIWTSWSFKAYVSLFVHIWKPHYEMGWFARCLLTRSTITSFICILSWVIHSALIFSFIFIILDGCNFTMLPFYWTTLFAHSPLSRVQQSASFGSAVGSWNHRASCFPLSLSPRKLKCSQGFTGNRKFPDAEFLVLITSCS